MIWSIGQNSSTYHSRRSTLYLKRDVARFRAVLRKSPRQSRQGNVYPNELRRRKLYTSDERREVSWLPSPPLVFKFGVKLTRRFAS